MIQDAETELRDQYFQYWIHHMYDFFMAAIGRYESRALVTSNLVKVKVRLDQKSTTYLRRADTIFNGLESIGGFYESLKHIGILLVFYFRGRLFTSSFLRQLYQVDPEKLPTKLSVPQPEGMIQVVESDSKIDDNYIKRILDYMLLRTRLNYYYYEIFHYLFTCRFLKRSRHPKSLIDRRHRLYAIGLEKLERELDVVNIIKNLRQLRIMTRFVLTSD